MQDFDAQGWIKFPNDPDILNWVIAAKPSAIATTTDPQHAQWLRCQGTWFAGVNVLDNDLTGAIGDSGPLNGKAINFAKSLGGTKTWDRAQVSVIYPGYPLQENESDAAFAYRQRRDAAHVDGLTRVGPERRRFLGEPHAFVLGIPLTKTSQNASPMVVWEGSHTLMRDAFRSALHDIPTNKWTEVDLTEVYQTTRRRCFEQCPRVQVHANPGEAYLIHRLALHGVAPWVSDAKAPPEGRMIAYFRPVLADVAKWLS